MHGGTYLTEPEIPSSRFKLLDDIRDLVTELDRFTPSVQRGTAGTSRTDSPTASAADTDRDDLGVVLAIPIGVIESPLIARAEAPKQGSEGGPEAWITIEPRFLPGLLGLEPGTSVVVLTWLHQAQRHLLQVHPRDDQSVPLTGVFRTRSADRPNPIGLHPVQLLEIVGNRLRVGPIEAVNGTPVLDIKPALPPTASP